MPYIGSEDTVRDLRRVLSNPNVQSDQLRYRNTILKVIRLPSLVEYVEQPLTAGLRDRAACVRRVAVLGWAKLHNLQTNSEIDAAVVNELYSLLRDPDPVVMVNCLRALEEILREEGGVAINKPITHHLLNRLKECDIWGQCEVLRILQRYRPQSEDELFNILSLLDVSLISPHPPVMAATLSLFLSLCSGLPAVGLAALERVRGPLLAACGNTSREMQFTALCHIQLLLRSLPGLMGEHYKRFFCGYAEPAYIKQRKIEVLVELVNDDNVAILLDELRGYCTDVNISTAHAAISAIGRIGRSYSDKCLEILTELLGLKQEHITSAVVQTMRDLVWVCPQCSRTVCSAVEGCEAEIQDSQGRHALLWLLGVYGEQVSSVPYTLEVFIDGVRSEASVGVKMELLTATVRLFLCRPAETQDMLGRLLHYCIEEETNMCVSDQALLYYRLLHCGIEETRKVLQCRRSDPSLGVLIGRPAEPINQWSYIFNTLEPLRPGAIETESATIGGSPEHMTFDPKPNNDLSDTLSYSFGKTVRSGESEHVQCPTIFRCSPQSLQAAMQLVNIQTLAFTPPHTLPWRVYLYTNTQNKHSADTCHGTLILGELLYTGEEIQKKSKDEENVGVEARQDKREEEREEDTAEGRSEKERVKKNTAEKGIKVTLKQQPRDEKALKGFLSVLTTVLHALSSE
uniref:Beta-adaptin appendage C-terminal subdomain domain-containing protein n=1 Tax=Echeneis naucrates TaxID=173247 RepID=A0A665UV31_ECHNA